MKAAKYYSLRRAWNHGLGYRPVGITSEKRARWYGRDLEYGEGTNGRLGDLVGRFDTEEAVKAAIAGLREIANRHKPVIDAIDAKRKEAQNEWNKEERAYVETFARDRAKEDA